MQKVRGFTQTLGTKRLQAFRVLSMDESTAIHPSQLGHTEADNKRPRQIQIHAGRPLRFEYSSLKLVILSVTYMAIQDHDMKTDDRVELDRTPFRALLRKDIDLLRDDRILEVGEVDDVSLQDENPDLSKPSILVFQKRD